MILILTWWTEQKDLVGRAGGAGRWRLAEKDCVEISMRDEFWLLWSSVGGGWKSVTLGMAKVASASRKAVRDRFTRYAASGIGGRRSERSATAEPAGDIKNRTKP